MIILVFGVMVVSKLTQQKNYLFSNNVRLLKYLKIKDS